MQKTPHASPRPTHRSVIWATGFAASAALLVAGGCDSGTGVLEGAGGGVSGSGIAPVAGTTSQAGSTSSSGGSSSSVGGASSGGGGISIGGFGNVVAGGGGVTSPTGGTTSSSGGAGGSAPKPCVDTPPPPDPEWPDAVCENWALETTACGEDWFKDYCDISCGRCVPEGGGGSGGGPAVDCSTQGLPNVTSGQGFATRYWDCCQTHCAQFNGHRCGQDGVSNTGNNQSACNGGASFACYDEAPRAISDCLSYGHVAKANPNCGQCYRIQFTGEGQHNANDVGSKMIKGKQMIVKVTNTGSDVAGNQFDLMIPGGGVGQFNACSRQWNATDLGAQYGGFLSKCTGAHSSKKECVRTECNKIPAGKARDGCLWFVDWFQVADNPKFTSEQTNCPF